MLDDIGPSIPLLCYQLIPFSLLSFEFNTISWNFIYEVSEEESHGPAGDWRPENWREALESYDKKSFTKK
ncbi:MAG: hypothetical protein M3250_08285 [Thermoproteota archaeon]|nr:hypothetical protein [Thermoproteota archaeon]